MKRSRKELERGMVRQFPAGTSIPAKRLDMWIKKPFYASSSQKMTRGEEPRKLAREKILDP